MAEVLSSWQPPSSLVDDVRRRYDEPHRRYHDRRHLTAVETNVEVLLTHSPAATGDDAAAIRLAALFHDAVYDVGAHDNESRSANLARTLLARCGAPSSLVDEVARLVLLTTDHAPTAGDLPGAILCDADLAILGAPPAEYRRYAADVRAEWAHLDDAGFAYGRAAVLRRLLDRQHLFVTRVGNERWESAARRNITDELARLAPS